MVGPDVGSGAVTAMVDQPIGNFTVTLLVVHTDHTGR